MPIPDNSHDLEVEIAHLYDEVLRDAARPDRTGAIAGTSAQLNALGQLGLTNAIGKLRISQERAIEVQERAIEAQNQTTARLERLEITGLRIARAALAFAVIQVIVALLQWKWK